jgi:hydrogenase nickel incorporation protein HypB
MRVNVIQSVLKANDAVAAANRLRLERAGVLALNLMSAPGSGKTSLLQRTILLLREEHACGVLAGDLQTTRDAERLESLALETVQINTGTGCHLLATQVSQALDSLPLDRLRFLFIENVGNMVCPAAFDLGEHRKVALLSVTEGDDKVAKYPTLFQQADVILITKIDLLHVVDFDRRQVAADLGRINTRAPVFEVSSRTGEGFGAWVNWLISSLPGTAGNAPTVRPREVHAPVETAVYLG